METSIKQIGIATLFMLLFSGVANMFAQDNDNYLTISGVVRDKANRKKLEYVNISVPGSNLRGITNEDGAFVLKIKDSIQAKEIEFSRIGYFNALVPVDGKDMSDQTFYLTKNHYTISTLKWKIRNF